MLQLPEKNELDQLSEEKFKVVYVRELRSNAVLPEDHPGAECIT
jgi:hypothetical protein